MSQVHLLDQKNPNTENRIAQSTTTCFELDFFENRILWEGANSQRNEIREFEGRVRDMKIQATMNIDFVEPLMVGRQGRRTKITIKAHVMAINGHLMAHK